MINDRYIPLFNSAATNLLGQLSVQKNDAAAVQKKFSHDAQIRNDDLCVTIEDFGSLKAPLSVGTLKVLDVLLLQLTAQNGIKTKNPDPVVKVFLEDYMSLLRIPETKNARDEARKNLKNYLDTLARMSLEFTENVTIKGKSTNGNTVSSKTAGPMSKVVKKRLNCKLFENYAIQKGVIRVKFTTVLVEHLISHSFITMYPAALFHLNVREAVSYYLGKKLCFNYGLMKNVANNRNDFISVKSLLKAAPALRLNKKDPSHWRRDVLDVFESAMTTLQQEGIIDEWHYSYAKRQPVVGLDDALKTYEKFSEKLFVQYKINDFPLPTPKKRKSPTPTP